MPTEVDRNVRYWHKADMLNALTNVASGDKADSKEVANKSIDHTTPVLLTFDETFDIGSDTRTAVDDADYQVPFPFTGTISKVDFKLGPSQLLPEDNKAAHEKNADK